MHRNRKRPGRASKFSLAVATAISCLFALVPMAHADPFAIERFASVLENEDGSANTTAGARPWGQVADFALTLDTGPEGLEGPTGNLEDTFVDLPPGIVGNIADIPTCPQQVMNVLPSVCPAGSIVGTALLRLATTTVNGGAYVPIYNLEPPPGMPAQFAFVVVASITHINFHVRSGSDYGVSATVQNSSEAAPVMASKVRIWGVPGDPSHDAQRCFGCYDVSEKPPVPYPEPAPYPTLLSNPTSCTGPLSTRLAVTSWQEPHKEVVTEAETPGMTECDQLDFDPSIEVDPSADSADSPTGLDFRLHVPQNQDSEGRATAHLKESKVVLPPTLTVNPSSANGLGACTPAQIGLETAPGVSPAQFSPDPANCPDSAKLGTVEVESLHVIDHPLKGSVYLASQGQNPFGSLLAMYIAVEDPESGIVLKLPGKIEADPTTGQLTTVFPDAPQLPFEDLELSFFQGAGSALKTGIACGQFKTQSDMVPWSTPEGATKHPSVSFAITGGAGGNGCVTSEAQAPNSPSFEAGTVDPIAGSYSPFVLKLSRGDGTQQLTGIDTTLPQGLVARLAGVPYCSEAALASVAQKTGRQEQQSPSCPAASQVGKVTVGAGAGPTPFYTNGNVYLAGPYKGAPLSLAVIVPAVAGPLDVGDVLVRNALYVNPESAQVRAVSDPFPTILKGIPLDLRSVALTVDRSQFTLNPTNCAPKTLAGQITALTGQTSLVSQRFQVGDCARLGFKPKLKLSLLGGTKRTKHPALKAVLTPRPGDANIARAAVTLPKSQFLENAHIGTVCTRVQYAADSCPKASVYGFAKAFSPLIEEPLKGPVYLRSSNHTLPDLVASLDGQIHVDLAGRIDSVKARLRSTFEATPDVPVTKFVLEMQGGDKGLLVNNRNLCARPNRATALFDAQNGKTFDAQPVVKVSCGGKKKGRGKKRNG